MLGIFYRASVSSLPFQKHIYLSQNSSIHLPTVTFSVTRGYWPNNGTEGLASRRALNNIQRTYTHTHTQASQDSTIQRQAPVLFFSAFGSLSKALHSYDSFEDTLFSSFILCSSPHFSTTSAVSLSPPVSSAPQPPSWTVTLYNHLGTYAAAIFFLQASLKLKYSICSDRAMTGE